MKFEKAIRGVAGDIALEEAKAAIREAHGKRATRWLADQAGISMRSAQRWMSDTPASRASTLIRLAQGAVIAQRMKNATHVTVGEVRVRYGGTRDEGTRTPYNAQTGSEDFGIASLGLDSRGFYDALVDNDFNKASEHFGRAILDDYDWHDENFEIFEWEDDIDIF